MTQYTAQQVAAIQAASVIIEGPAIEIAESTRKKTQKGQRNVVTGKRGNYQFVLVDNNPIGRLYYISSFALKQATAQKAFAAPQRPAYGNRDFNSRPSRSYEEQRPARRRVSQLEGGNYGSAGRSDFNDRY